MSTIIVNKAKKSLDRNVNTSISKMDSIGKAGTHGVLKNSNRSGSNKNYSQNIPKNLKTLN